LVISKMAGSVCILKVSGIDGPRIVVHSQCVGVRQNKWLSSTSCLVAHLQAIQLRIAFCGVQATPRSLGAF
jgi:hypothetical protein